MYLKSRNSLLYLGEPCVGYFRISLHKSSHNLLIEFEEVTEINENM